MITIKTRPHKPMLAEWTYEFLSLSLSLDLLGVYAPAMAEAACVHM